MATLLATNDILATYDVDDRRGGTKSKTVVIDINDIAAFTTADSFRWRFNLQDVAPWATKAIVMYRGVTTTANKSLSFYWSHDGTTLSSLLLDGSMDGGTADQDSTGSGMRISAQLAGNDHILAVEPGDVNQTTAIVEVKFIA